jgi:hypothetical protein
MADTYSGLQRENRQLKQLLRRHGIEVPFSDRFDDEDYDEDEYDDSLEEPSEPADFDDDDYRRDAPDYTRQAGKAASPGA